MGISIKAAAAEFLAMTMFVVICVGAAMTNKQDPGSSGKLQQVSLTFGFCITALAYSVGHHSGGQINCAVTFGLVVGRMLSSKLGIEEIGICPVQGLVNFVAQMLGSLFGSCILAIVIKTEADATHSFGANMVNKPDYDAGQAMIAEIVGTFFLMYVVLETAVNKKTENNRTLACMAIGITVYLGHSLLIPITGCSINPTRSFGPAVLAGVRYSDVDGASDKIWEDHWVFWIGPLLGALIGVLVFIGINKLGDGGAGGGDGENKPIKDHNQVQGDNQQPGGTE